MIPLFTSIPPCFTRQNLDGQEIGLQYAIKCVQSWRDNGFDPITVNAENESVSEIISSENLKRITVQQDFINRFGKPLISLGDFVSAACSFANGPVVITNADILIDMSPTTYQCCENIKPGECLVVKRCDIREIDSRDGVEYLHGYDFFAYHTEDLKKFYCDELVIGMPWWDHYLPVSMYLNGMISLSVNEPFAFHLVHNDRWDLKQI